MCKKMAPTLGWAMLCYSSGAEIGAPPCKDCPECSSASHMD
jgi:hypothetical protein